MKRPVMALRPNSWKGFFFAIGHTPFMPHRITVRAMQTHTRSAYHALLVFPLTESAEAPSIVVDGSTTPETTGHFAPPSKWGVAAFCSKFDHTTPGNANTRCWVHPIWTTRPFCPILEPQSPVSSGRHRRHPTDYALEILIVKQLVKYFVVFFNGPR
jgi:hypothetical protein